MAAAAGAAAVVEAGDDEKPPAPTSVWGVVAGGEELWGLPLTSDEEAGFFFESPFLTSSTGSSSPGSQCGVLPGSQRGVLPDDEFICEEASTDGSDCDSHHGHWQVSLDYTMDGTAGEMTGPMPQDTARTLAVDLGVLAAANAFAIPETRTPAAANGALRSPVVRLAAALPAGSMKEGAQRSSRKRSMDHDSNTGTVTGSLSGQTGECPICLCP
eukprot:COSAG02_NODE_4027_length_5886_cov_4.820287_2_plen_214_part_00